MSRKILNAGFVKQKNPMDLKWSKADSFGTLGYRRRVLGILTKNGCVWRRRILRRRLIRAFDVGGLNVFFAQ
jgi:hypothetical protein